MHLRTWTGYETNVVWLGGPQLATARCRGLQRLAISLLSNAFGFGCHLENGAVLSRSLLCPYQVLNQGC